MAKVLVLYYSSYGHIETLAHAVAEGAREAGATVDVKRVPETVPEEVAKANHFKLDQAAPIATVDDIDGITRLAQRFCDPDGKFSVIFNEQEAHDPDSID